MTVEKNGVREEKKAPKEKKITSKTYRNVSILKKRMPGPLLKGRQTSK